MSDGDCATVHVDSRAVEPELFLDREVLRAERLVDLEPMDLLDAHPGLLREGADRGRGPDAHDCFAIESDSATAAVRLATSRFLRSSAPRDLPRDLIPRAAARALGVPSSFARRTRSSSSIAPMSLRRDVASETLSASSFGRLAPER